jgi:hypothetical protein
MTFGNPFGLALYDKSQRQVSGSPATRETASASNNPGHGNGQQPIQRNGQDPGRSQASHRPDTYAAPSRRTSAQANPIPAAFNGPPRNHGQGSNGTRATSAPAAIARPQAVPNSASIGTTSPANEAALDPATIATLQERIRALLPPRLAAFSRAFRTAFQVPDSTPSIAGLITEHRHRLWIENFLGRLQSPQLQSQNQQARTA